MSRFLIVIPARYASTRFPGKPLAKIGGEEMILRVCRRAALTGFDLLVATDDERIRRCVEKAGFDAVMTPSDLPNGTRRVCAALEITGRPEEYIINLQADEPFIDPSQIFLLADTFDDSSAQIATLARRFDPSESFYTLRNPNNVKTVIDRQGRAMLFSRSVVPFVRGVEPEKWPETTAYYIHIGAYAFRRDVLEAVCTLPPSPLEQAERLEQLGWLDAGYRVDVRLTDHPTLGIDTPADLLCALRHLP